MAPPTQGEIGEVAPGPPSLRPGPAKPPDDPRRGDPGAPVILGAGRRRGSLVEEWEEEAGGLRKTFPGVYSHARIGAKAAGMRLSLFILLCPQGN